jgi:hypothetical protein
MEGGQNSASNWLLQRLRMRASHHNDAVSCQRHRSCIPHVSKATRDNSFHGNFVGASYSCYHFQASRADFAVNFDSFVVTSRQKNIPLIKCLDHADAELDRDGKLRMVLNARN